MGAHSDYIAEAALEETYTGGTNVAAATGFYVLDERDQSPEPVIAWRVGSERVLPITRWGVVCRECFVAYPDGRVRHHGAPGPAEVPSYASVEEWRTSEFGPKRPSFGRHPLPERSTAPDGRPWGSASFEKALDEIDHSRGGTAKAKRAFHVVADADAIPF